jgi:DNA-binding transcriptional LysR family regulator
MNDRQLSYMLTILKEGSISRAAEVLCISQPSLSQMVRKIENEIHAEIFERHHTPIALTPAGECYIRAAQDILNIQKNMSEQIREIHTGARGTLRIGCPVQRAIEILPRFFPEYHRRFPNVEIQLVESGSDQLETMLENNSLDVGFITTTPKVNHLLYYLAANEETVLLASKTAPIASRVTPGTPIGIRDAADENFIAIKEGHSIRITEDRLFASANIRPNLLLETRSIEVAKRLVGPAGAVMLCPKNYIDMSPEIYDDCVIYPVRGIEQERHFYICLPKETYVAQYLAELIRMFIPSYIPELSAGV